MAGDPVALIERLAANAWPAATVRHADGWLLRTTPGVARRRSNSALPPPSAATAGPARLASALDRAERFYAARHLYLQVEEDNLPARRLFTRLGFRPSHHYHYRVAR